MQQYYRILTLILTISLLNLAGCVYRPTVQQGNILTKSNTQAIHKGMLKSQVIQVLGAPTLVNIYRNNQLVYVYTLQPNRQAKQERKLLIYFQSNRVTDYKLFSSPNLQPLL